MKELKRKMKENAKAYNKHLTDEYLDALSINRLMKFTHPINKGDFITEYLKAKKQEATT